MYMCIHCIVYMYMYVTYNLWMESFQPKLPRLSTENEFNWTVSLPTEKIFFGRLSTQASNVKVFLSYLVLYVSVLRNFFGNYVCAGVIVDLLLTKTCHF